MLVANFPVKDPVLFNTFLIIDVILFIKKHLQFFVKWIY
jgi:hypothetical protein